MQVLALLSLVWMIRSDWRQRAVSVWHLALFTGCLWTDAIRQWGGEVCLLRVAGNGAVLLFLGMAAFVYFTLRHGRPVNLLRGYFGSGDAAFLFCLAPGFAVAEYVRFLVITFTLSVVAYVLVPAYWDIGRSVPLVSTVGVCYEAYVLYGFIFIY